METLRKCSAVPNFVHLFNKLHKDYLSLPELHIEDYENCLLPSEQVAEEVYDPQILINIVIKLLKGCGQAYVREDSCLDILRTLAIRKWNLYGPSGISCPFIVSVEGNQDAETQTLRYLEFSQLAPEMKAETMLVLINVWMMGHLVKMNFIDKMEPDELRIEPDGYDLRGYRYFYLCGSRLYCEIVTEPVNEDEDEKRDWNLIATDVETFKAVVHDLKKLCAAGRTRALINLLENTIIPSLPDVLAKREEQLLLRRADFRRKRSAALAAARESARIEQQAQTMERRRARQAEKNIALSEKAVQRAERYKRRSQLLEGDWEATRENIITRRRTAESKKRYNVKTMSKEEVLEEARRLLQELFSRPVADWPEMPPPDLADHDASNSAMLCQ